MSRTYPHAVQAALVRRGYDTILAGELVYGHWLYRPGVAATLAAHQHLTTMENLQNALPNSPEQWVAAAVSLVLAILGWWRSIKAPKRPK